MQRIREIVDELVEKYGLKGETSVVAAGALAEFLDAVRSAEFVDAPTGDEARHAARQVAASVIGILVPEIASELAERLADRRISEAA